MKQHKNDLNPGPLTESVCSGRSCCQANLPDNDQAPVQQPVEGRQRLKSILRKGWPGIERVKTDWASYIGLKNSTKAQTGNPGIINLYPQVKLPGFLHCLDATEFRRRTASLKTDPAKTELVVLYPNSNDKITNGRIVGIFHEIALKPPGSNVYSLCIQISQRSRKVKSRFKTCFRLRKTLSLSQLVASLIKQEFPGKADNRIFEACKLKVC